MTIDECAALLEADLRKCHDGEDPNDLPRFAVKSFRAAEKKLDVRLPESWLRLLPHAHEVIWNSERPDDYCSIYTPDSMVKWNEPFRNSAAEWPPYDAPRWLKFGSTDGGDEFTFDLESPAMPQDARVVWWCHETGEPEKEWAGVVEFIQDMLAPGHE